LKTLFTFQKTSYPNEGVTVLSLPLQLVFPAVTNKANFFPPIKKYLFVAWRDGKSTENLSTI
jgi:hypothetical protein